MAPLNQNVLTIVCCTFKLLCKLLKRSEAIKANFKNIHKWEKHPEERDGGGGGESKANLVLLIYLTLTAQRFKRNKDWNCSGTFSATQLTYLFILLACPLHSRHIREQENTATHGSLHSSTQHRASFDVLIHVGFHWWTGRRPHRMRDRTEPVFKKLTQLNLRLSRTDSSAEFQLLYRAVLPHVHDAPTRQILSLITIISHPIQAGRVTPEENLTRQAVY